MGAADLGFPRKIGDGARDTHDPVIPARRQGKPFCCAQEQRARFGIWADDGFKQVTRRIGIGRNPVMRRVARGLKRPRGGDPCRDLGRGLAIGGQVEIAVADGRHVDAQVEPVHQWAGDTPEIVFPAGRDTGAGAGRVGQVAAFAGVRRRDEHEAARVFHMGIGPRDHDLASLDRLAQGFEDRAVELGEFVHEQHTVMGQRCLPRSRLPTAADDRGHRGRVMRLAKGAAAGNAALIQQPGEGVYHRGLQRFTCRQRR